MPTSPIPPEKARLLRLLRKAAVVYLLLHCTHDPLGESDIAAALQLDRQTVRSYLRSLHASDLVARLASGRGWVLTPAGHQLFAALTPLPLSPVPSPVSEATLPHP